MTGSPAETMGATTGADGSINGFDDSPSNEFNGASIASSSHKTRHAREKCTPRVVTGRADAGRITLCRDLASENYRRRIGTLRSCRVQQPTRVKFVTHDKARC